MINVAEINKKAKRKYKDFLKFKVGCLLHGQKSDEFDFFPLSIKSDKGKATDELFQREKDLRLLLENSKEKSGAGFSLEFAKKKTRNNGMQTVIKSIYFETEMDYLSFIKEKHSYEKFCTALEQIQNSGLLTNEKLCEWAKSHLNDLCSKTEGEHFWSDICLCADWLNKNQGSNLYIREIPLPVHTKFIENNKKIIQSLTKKAESELSFEATFGLKTKPDFVWFRTICENVKLPFSKITLSECRMLLDDFKDLDDDFLNQIENVFIVENEMVYLTFPKALNSICVFGQGYKVNILNGIGWFKDKNLYYFGDLDEHGFDILSTYRRYYPQIKSFCMNKSVLEKYKYFMVEGKALDCLRMPENLTDSEKECFMLLRNLADKKNRLEQERISITYLNELLKKYELL